MTSVSRVTNEKRLCGIWDLERSILISNVVTNENVFIFVISVKMHDCRIVT